MIKRIVFFITLFVMLQTASLDTNAADDQALDSRMKSIENSLSILQKHVYNLSAKREEASVKNKGDRYIEEIADLADQIREMRGELERMRYNQRLSERQMQKLISELEKEISSLKGSLTKKKKDTEAKLILDSLEDRLEDTSLSYQGTDSYANFDKHRERMKKKGSLSKSPEELYNQAYSLLQNKNYDKAKKMFNELVDTHTTHEIASGAFYWLGEIYYLQGNYSQAAIQYLRGYQANIKGNKAPDNLLKLAQSLAKLDKRQEACTTLYKVQGEFPEASNFIKQQIKESLEKLYCVEQYQTSN